MAGPIEAVPATATPLPPQIRSSTSASSSDASLRRPGQERRGTDTGSTSPPRPTTSDLDPAFIARTSSHRSNPPSLKTTLTDVFSQSQTSVTTADSQHHPPQQPQPSSPISPRPRLQSVSHATPSLAYPQDQPYTATSASRASPPNFSAALHSLQAAAVSSSQHSQSGPSLDSAATSSTPSSGSLSRVTTLSSPPRPSFGTTPSSPEDLSSRNRTQSSTAAVGLKRNQTISPSHYTTLEHAAAAAGKRHERPYRSTTGRRSSINTVANLPTLEGYEQPQTRDRIPRVVGSGGLEAKVVILGAQGVGKTSIVYRYTSGEFNASAVPSTIGASFLTKKLVVDDVKCRLQIWDTAGQERFRSMAPMYYRGSNAAIIVYDVTSMESFADVKTWIEELKKNMGDELVIHIVGSKLDLAPYAREVDREDAREQVLRWLYPEREMAIAVAEEQASLSAQQATQTTSSSRLGTLSSLAMGSASRLAIAFPSSSRPGAARMQTSTSSNGSGSGGTAEDFGEPGVPFLPGDDADIELTEVSAKDDEGIEEVFVSITQKLVQRKADIEHRRQLRERNSIFLTGDNFDDGTDGSRQNPGAHQSWTCC